MLLTELDIYQATWCVRTLHKARIISWHCGYMCGVSLEVRLFIVSPQWATLVSKHVGHWNKRKCIVRNVEEKREGLGIFFVTIYTVSFKTVFPLFFLFSSITDASTDSNLQAHILLVDIVPEMWWSSAGAASEYGHGIKQGPVRCWARGTATATQIR